MHAGVSHQAEAGVDSNAEPCVFLRRKHHGVMDTPGLADGITRRTRDASDLACATETSRAGDLRCIGRRSASHLILGDWEVRLLLVWGTSPLEEGFRPGGTQTQRQPHNRCHTLL